MSALNGLAREASGEAQEGSDGPRLPGEGGSPRALLEVLEAAQAIKGGAVAAQTGPACAIARESSLPPVSDEVPQLRGAEGEGRGRRGDDQGAEHGVLV